jgi:hypothetical protein
MGLYNTVPVVSQTYGNTGKQNFSGDIGVDEILIAVPRGETIATKVLAETLATWTAKINAAQASRWFPIGRIVDAEKPAPDAVYKETGYGYKFWVKDNKPTFKYMLEPMSIYNKTQLNKLSLKSFDFFVATAKDYIHGWVNGEEFCPYTVDFFRVTPATGISGTEGEYIWIEIQYNDVTQFNLSQAAINPTVDSEAPAAWYPTLELVGIKDLVATPVSASTSGFVLDLAGFDGTPYSGAVAADIAIYKSPSTTPITCTGLTESGTIPGRYTGTWATQTAGDFTIGLLPQPTATTKGFETPTLGEITF